MVSSCSILRCGRLVRKKWIIFIMRSEKDNFKHNLVQESSSFWTRTLALSQVVPSIVWGHAVGFLVSHFLRSFSVCLFYHSSYFWNWTLFFFVLMALQKVIDTRLCSLSLEVALKMIGLVYSAWERGKVLCSSWNLDCLWVCSFPDCGRSFLFGLSYHPRRWLQKTSQEFWLFCLLAAKSLARTLLHT